MENEAAPTGGRLASPEVIGGKSNRHSGEKGAPQAPFFHALFRVAAGRFGRRGAAVRFGRKGAVGTLWGRGWKGRRRVGRRGRGAVGAFFSCLFLGGRGGRGLPRGRAVVTGFAAGAGRSVEGVRAGGGWSRGVRAPFFCCLGEGAIAFWGRSSFFGGYGGEGGSARERRGGGERGGVNEGERELRRGREGKARRGWGVRTGGGGGARAPFPIAALPAPLRSPRGGRCAPPQVRRTFRRPAARPAASLWPHLSPLHFYHASSPLHFCRTSRRPAA